MKKANVFRLVSAFLAVLMIILSLAACSSKPASAGETTDSLPVATKAQTNETESDLTDPQPQASVELVLDEDESEKGLITFTVKYRSAGEFTLCFADENGIIEGFPALTEEPCVVNGAQSSDAVLFEARFEDVTLPPGTDRIIADDGVSGEQYTLEIDEAYDLAEDAFVFAALSDVHYNRYNYTGTGDDGVVFFDMALDFIDTLNVDLVAVSGDVSNEGEVDSLKKFNDAIAGRDYPVYTCTGNHDVSAVSAGTWKQYMNGDIYDPENSEIFEVAENGLDFVYKPDGLNGDVFVFLSQVRWEYGDYKEDTILDDDQLSWLEEVLDQYKEQDVYLFFHTFLCGPDGEGHTGVGNLSNGKYEYDLPYTYGADDEELFRRMLKKYKNVMFFSGHSHWTFEMAMFNPITNFSNFDGEYAYMIHIPSVTEPRAILPDESSRFSMNGRSSQGWIVYDYGDTVLLLPVEFIEGEFMYDYMEIIHTGESAK